MYLALTDVFRAKWTDAIHEEWMRNVQRDYPDITRAQVERTRDLMNAHVRDCLVTGYEDLIKAISLPDPGHRHVVAAAIRAGADVIVTSNLNDFPKETLAKYGIDPNIRTSLSCTCSTWLQTWSARLPRSNGRV